MRTFRKSSRKRGVLLEFLDVVWVGVMSFIRRISCSSLLKGLILLPACSVHFVRRQHGRLLWDSVEIAQHRRRTKRAEHASKKILIQGWRSNVTQSALGRNALRRQLGHSIPHVQEHLFDVVLPLHFSLQAVV